MSWEKTDTIKSLDEYVTKVYDICVQWGKVDSTTHPWFRGQDDASWDLLPRLYRSNENPIFEREMVREFTLRATPFLDKIPENEMEWLFVMQHYSLPTRLLDWTESHLVALYFAALNEESNTDSAVWILEPWSLNEVANDGPGFRIPTSKNSGYKNYTLKFDSADINREVKAKDPVAVRPLRNTPRIVAQRGVFTIHGNKKISLNSYASKKNKSSIKLKKIMIDQASKIHLKKELFLAGITHSSLFPDLDGLAKEIHFRYSKHYLSFDLTGEESSGGAVDDETFDERLEKNSDPRGMSKRGRAYGGSATPGPTGRQGYSSGSTSKTGPGSHSGESRGSGGWQENDNGPTEMSRSEPGKPTKPRKKRKQARKSREP